MIISPHAFLKSFSRASYTNKLIYNSLNIVEYLYIWIVLKKKNVVFRVNK